MLLFVLVTGAIAARAWWAPAANTKQPSVAFQAAAPPANPVATPDPNYVRRALIAPQLMSAFKALGNRLETPGHERLTLVGTLSRPQQAKGVSPVRLILEFPGQLRLEEQAGSLLKVTLVGTGGASKLGGPLATQDEDEVESLLHDSADHFFAGRIKGLAMRALGQHFRLDDGTATNYTGPYYDIYQLNDQVSLTAAARPQQKFYYFNSQTQLLESVRYDLQRGGSVVKVETQISDWKNVGGQQLPGTITRLENGQPVLVLNIVID
jgi:hypothetical protein